MKQTRALILPLVVGFLIVSNQASLAWVSVTQEQSQSVSSSGNASVTCEGNCTGSAEANSSATGRQWQRTEVTVGGAAYPTRAVAKRGRVAGAYVGWSADGEVRLNWSLRGGTCHVRYTEASESVYKYATSASCDDGGVTIGGLTPGVSYRFQVRQNDGPWSRAVVVRVR